MPLTTEQVSETKMTFAKMAEQLRQADQLDEEKYARVLKEARQDINLMALMCGGCLVAAAYTHHIFYTLFFIAVSAPAIWSTYRYWVNRLYVINFGTWKKAKVSKVSALAYPRINWQLVCETAASKITVKVPKAFLSQVQIGDEIILSSAPEKNESYTVITGKNADLVFNKNRQSIMTNQIEPKTVISAKAILSLGFFACILCFLNIEQSNATTPLPESVLNQPSAPSEPPPAIPPENSSYTGEPATFGGHKIVGPIHVYDPCAEIGKNADTVFEGRYTGVFEEHYQKMECICSAGTEHCGCGAEYVDFAFDPIRTIKGSPTRPARILLILDPPSAVEHTDEGIHIITDANSKAWEKIFEKDKMYRVSVNAPKESDAAFSNIVDSTYLYSGCLTYIKPLTATGQGH